MASGARQSDSASRGPGTEVTILVVDDEPAVRRVVARMLRAHGFTVHEGNGGTDALRVATGLVAPVDVLLTDVVMPDMDGPQLAAAMAKTSPTTKVLFMSGHPGQPPETLTANGAEFIAKPFGPAPLIERIARLVPDKLR